MENNVIVVGSITDLENADGALVLTGSHGGASVGRWSLQKGSGALICHDAGIGLGDAGVAALAYLDTFGVPAAATDFRSARIGDAEHMLAEGRISRVNRHAAARGVQPADSVAVAAERLASSAHAPKIRPDGNAETFRRREFLVPPDARAFHGIRVVILDSASTVHGGDDGAVIVTGSHGGLPGNRPARAMKARPLLAIFNDAGIGFDNAGIRRLNALEGHGIAGACVHASSARIGDGESTYADGVISSINPAAARLGVLTEAAVAEIVRMLAAKAPEPASPLRK